MNEPYYDQGGITIYCGDSREIVPTLGTFDAIVTDPPYGLSFMGADWDHGVPGLEFWRLFLAAVKPGAHLLAFGGSRTSHRLACAIEDACWEIRDSISWLYGSGFPKSLDVGKAIDKAAGVEREVIAKTGQRCGVFKHSGNGTPQDINDYEATITAPATDLAKQWDGWGTALKPSVEPIIFARKPIEGRIVDNVLKYGTGAINVDACRVGTRDVNESGWSKSGSKASDNRAMSGGNYEREAKDEAGTGRWPANLIISCDCPGEGHVDGCEVVAGFPETSSGKMEKHHVRHTDKHRAVYGAFEGSPAAGNGKEFGGDSGSASRFFKKCPFTAADFLPYCYTAKASGKDRGNLPAEDFPLFGESYEAWRNTHSTVKPTSLMRYLVRLVTPLGGIILDPFVGSGTTLVAANLEGHKAVGVELDERHCEIAANRLATGELANVPYPA